jgi:uncharacterized membrane protein
MNMPHLHLLLNHFPTVGMTIAVALLVLSFIRRNEGMRRAAYEVFCVIALLTLPAYLSGVGTEIRIVEMEGVSKLLIDRHHDAALMASIFMVLTGAVAWLALWQSRRLSRPSGPMQASVMVLAVITMALMARAATMGGEIRHPEILADPQVAAEVTEALVDPAPLSAAWVAGLVTGRVWLWPASEALHFIGLCLLFGVVLLVNLRMLGVMKGASYSALHRLLPWAVLGLVVNVITGMLFVIGAPGQYMDNTSFYWKIGLLMLAGANLLYLTAFDEPWEVGPNDNPPFTAKAMAASSIVLWVGVMYYGRMLPFIGNAV